MSYIIPNSADVIFNILSEFVTRHSYSNTVAAHMQVCVYFGLWLSGLLFTNKNIFSELLLLLLTMHSFYFREHGSTHNPLFTWIYTQSALYMDLHTIHSLHGSTHNLLFTWMYTQSALYMDLHTICSLHGCTQSTFYMDVYTIHSLHESTTVKSSLCGGSMFPLLLYKWSFTVYV